MIGLVEQCAEDQRLECLLWDGRVNRWDQPRVRCHQDWWTGSRVAYEVVWGMIPEGMEVLHICDKPRCLNPFHLFAGTQQDNMIDAAQKRRLNLNQQGEEHPAAKLANAEIEEIRNSNLPQLQLAAIYGCSQSNISFIKSGKRRAGHYNQKFNEDAEVQVPQ